MTNFRRACFYCLHTPYPKSAKWINGIVAFLIIVSIACIPVYFLTNIGWLMEYRPHVIFLEKITITLFTVEYLLRIYSAPQPFRYMFSWWGLIDLVSILPFYISHLYPIGYPEIYTMIRVLRILKLAKINEIDHAKLICHCNEKGHGHFIPLQGETVEKIVQKHHIVFILNSILPLALTSGGILVVFIAKTNILGIALGVLILSFAAVFFAKAWLDYLYDVIYITDQRIILQNRKLFGTISHDIAYESITNIIPDDRGFFRWLLGFGDIQIQTAAGITPEVYSTPRPAKTVAHIARNRQKVLEEKDEHGEK